MESINVSIYFMWEWWEKYFHNTYPRPDKIDEDKLDEMYLKRKRFLYEKFGRFGLGERNPVMDGRYVNTVMKYGMDLLPYLFGMKLQVKEQGGWLPEKLSKEEIKKLEPVDLSNHPFGEWILREKERKKKRYGSVSSFLDFESPTNIAVRVRGEEFYIDLLEDEGFARHLLDVVTESIINGYRFQLQVFPDQDSFGLGNCNVTLMSPRLYEKVVRPYDIRFAKASEELTGKKNNTHLHHCDVKIDNFIESYKEIPNLASLQANHASDLERVKNEYPGVPFLAMFNPREMRDKSIDTLKEDFDRAVRFGVRELDLWNVDPGVTPEKFAGILEAILAVTDKYGKKACFDVVPFCWDELEWAFPRYQS